MSSLVAMVVSILLPSLAIMAGAIFVGWKNEKRRQRMSAMSSYATMHDPADPACDFFDPYRHGNRGHCLRCCPDDHESHR